VVPCTALRANEAGVSTTSSRSSYATPREPRILSLADDPQDNMVIVEFTSSKALLP